MIKIWGFHAKKSAKATFPIEFRSCFKQFQGTDVVAQRFQMNFNDENSLIRVFFQTTVILVS